jgi:uncharacterized membrane protein YqgA involved in biofilm formation
VLKFPGAGSVFNFITVALGGLIGWGIGSRLDAKYQEIALAALGIITLAIGVKMLLGAKNLVIVAAASAIGGVIGLSLGIHDSIENFAIWAKNMLNADSSSFVDVMLTTSVLFCIGPMTLLGCIQDRTEGKSELLNLKSIMDGFVSIFFGASSGPAMLVTAVVVLIFQLSLTAAAGLLKPIVEDEEMLADLSATGAVMLVGTGLSLLNIRSLQNANYLPAMVLTPLFLYLSRKISKAVSHS